MKSFKDYMDELWGRGITWEVVLMNLVHSENLKICRKNLKIITINLLYTIAIIGIFSLKFTEKFGKIRQN